MAKQSNKMKFNLSGVSSSSTDQLIEASLPESPRWLLGDGRHSDLVISCRIRLARNLKDFGFPNRAPSEKLNEILDMIEHCLEQTEELRGAVFVRLSDLEELDRQFLMERRLISPQFMKLERPCGLIIGPDEMISIMINEEDHLRIQALQSGLELERTWQLVRRIDDAFARTLNFAYSDQFGYLTACPTNTGTGMRVSVFIHLSALALSGRIEKIVGEIAPSEVAIRGFYGEGSDILGNIFQISNQLTLGRTEQSIMRRIENMTEQLIQLEQQASHDLLQENPLLVEDKVYRAIGTIKYARMLNSVEAVNLLSLIKLGSSMRLIDPIDHRTFNELLVLIQPAHLQKLNHATLSAQDRDILRIKLIRKRLNL
ncbi:MAG: protein arginine kinase [candidate division KSB1 bacterium]|nr:protein arginine kinase [candidate division KSB1 bacterium]MDZ7333799.1 protein arginine kinase [candidate division KSB1 bacterium]MDZ7356042.1 protein arginine kinase [candidate division KSB1 bacterium]MDZ7400559.1 protein arginine kinase [candidate division KSB1 bacterium]